MIRSEKKARGLPSAPDAHCRPLPLISSHLIHIESPLFVCLLGLFVFFALSIQAPLLAFDSVAAVHCGLRAVFLKVSLQQNRLMMEKQEQKACFVFAFFWRDFILLRILDG